MADLTESLVGTMLDSAAKSNALSGKAGQIIQGASDYFKAVDAARKISDFVDIVGGPTAGSEIDPNSGLTQREIQNRAYQAYRLFQFVDTTPDSSPSKAPMLGWEFNINLSVMAQSDPFGIPKMLENYFPTQPTVPIDVPTLAMTEGDYEGGPSPFSQLENALAAGDSSAAAAAAMKMPGVYQDGILNDVRMGVSGVSAGVSGADRPTDPRSLMGENNPPGPPSAVPVNSAPSSVPANELSQYTSDMGGHGNGQGGGGGTSTAGANTGGGGGPSASGASNEGGSTSDNNGVANHSGSPDDRDSKSDNGGLGGDPGHHGPQPVVLDLSGAGINITKLSSSNVFEDTTGDGYKSRTAWAGAGNAVLFVDPTSSNALTQTNQYVFTDWDPTAASDMQALKDVFDSNRPVWTAF